MREREFVWTSAAANREAAGLLLACLVAVCQLALVAPGCFGGDEGEETELAWVKVEGGSFVMGSDKAHGAEDNNQWPAHEVTLGTYWMSATEVTNAMFVDYLNQATIDNLGVGKGGKKEIDLINAMCGIEGNATDGFRVKSGMAGLPVVSVSGVGAMRFAEWVGARLPSEAEWEYAARGGKAGSVGRYSGATSAETMPNEVGWTATNAESGPRPVGTKPANGLGLHDMTGNVSEMGIAPNYYYPDHPMLTKGGGGNTQGPVLRGGSFLTSDVSVFDRSFAAHFEVTAVDVGFRLVRDTDPAMQ